MSQTFKVIVKIHNEDGSVANRTEVASHKLTAPEHIKNLGLTHTEQIDLLQNVIDSLLPNQVMLIEEPEICPKCGKRTRKNGIFSSHFHSVYTDHKIDLRRRTCSCGWKNKYNVEGKFGSPSHPDLLKMQCEFGAEHSFKKAEEILASKNGRNRPVNNHMHIMRLVDKVGTTLSDLKCNAPAEPKQPADILVAQIDGGHIRPKEQNICSYEVLAAKFYQLDTQAKKNNHHTLLKKSTCVASGLSDRAATIKKQVIYGAKSEGMTNKSIVYALSDGAKNCWSALKILVKRCKEMIPILDWEHIGRKFKNVEQMLAVDYHKRLESAKWRLWHGQSEVCLKKLNVIKDDLGNCNNKKLEKLIKYLQNNTPYLINYEEQRNKGLPYTSNVIESAIDTLINERQKRNKKMSWTRKGAHNILQIRASIASKTWRKDWDNAFEVMITA